jgi:hypothetical protein
LVSPVARHVESGVLLLGSPFSTSGKIHVKVRRPKHVRHGAPRVLAAPMARATDSTNPGGAVFFIMLAKLRLMPRAAFQAVCARFRKRPTPSNEHRDAMERAAALVEVGAPLTLDFDLDSSNEA